MALARGVLRSNRDVGDAVGAGVTIQHLGCQRRVSQWGFLSQVFSLCLIKSMMAGWQRWRCQCAGGEADVDG